MNKGKMLPLTAISDWNACEAQVDYSSLLGKPCFGGVVTSSRGDRAALGLAFPIPTEHTETSYLVLCRTWSVAEQGEVLDFNEVGAALRQSSHCYRLLGLAYDPWGSEGLMQRLEGIERIRFMQNAMSYDAPTRAFARDIRAKRVSHTDNPALRESIVGCAVTSRAGKAMPDGKRSTADIGPVCAVIMAMSGMNAIV